MARFARLGCNCAVIALLCGANGVAFGQITTAVDTAWDPITDAERDMKAPVVEKDAGVEALFWRVHVRDEFAARRDFQRVYYHYIRLKIFDEKGKERASTIDLPFTEKRSIVNVAGRTIKADGTELELKKDSVYERDILRAGRTRIRVKSFAMPGVEPGAIVEYRWQEIDNTGRSLYIRAQFQREFPVQKVTYFFAPLSSEYTTYRMSIIPFHCKLPPFQTDNHGYQSFTLENLPAFKEEPMMPGEANVRAWGLVFYTNEEHRDPEKYWANVGKEEYNRYLKPAMKSNDEIRQVAAMATSGAKTDEEKVLGLIRYIRKNLRDLYSRQVTEAERAEILKDIPKDRYRTAAEIFKSGIGNADELNTLFASMANAVDLDVRPALMGDREEVVFAPQLMERYFLRHIDMAANIGGNWKIYDVSTRNLFPGMLSWNEEGMQALLSDPKKSSFVGAPVAPPDASQKIRTAKFELSESGAIEGDVDLQYTGHVARERRTEFEGDSDARRVERLTDDLKKEYPDAEISGVAVENIDDPEKAVHLRYHIKMDGYAARTGKRVLLQPFFFERGVAPMFAASERKYPIYFPYAWQEHDNVAFELPAGFALDNADAPNSLNFGVPGSYNVKLMTRGGKELIALRDFTFGNQGRILFDAKVYPQLKQIFDEIHQRDDHTVSLKQAATAEAK